MDVATLRIVVDGDSSGASDALNSVERGMDSAQRSTGQMGRSLSKNVTAPIAGAVAGLGGLAVNAASTADDVVKSARAAGIGAESYQELEYALGQAGVEQKTFDRLLERNNQRLGRASQGNEKYAEAYDNLGVSIHDTNGELRNSESVFDDVLRSLAEIEDPAVRAAQAGDLLGVNAGRKLSAALDGGIGSIDEAREAAHDLGIVMDGEALDGAEDFMDGVDDLKRSFSGMVTEIGSELMPHLQELLPVVEENLVPAFQSFAKWVGRVIEWFADLPAPVQKVIGVVAALAAAAGPVLLVVSKIIKALKVLVPIFKALVVVGKVVAAVVAGISAPVLAVIAAIAALISIGVLLYRNWDQVAEMARRAWGAITDGVTAAVDWVRDGISDLVQWFRDLPGRILGALSNVGRQMMDAGRNIVRGLLDGIRSMASAPVDAVRNIVSGARNLLPFSPAKEGPFSGSGSPFRSGQAIAGDLAAGLSREADALHRELLRTLEVPEVSFGAGSGSSLSAPPAGGSGGTGGPVSVDARVTVEGNVDRDTLPELEAMLDDRNEKLYRDLLDAMAVR